MIFNIRFFMQPVWRFQCKWSIKVNWIKSILSADNPAEIYSILTYPFFSLFSNCIHLKCILCKKFGKSIFLVGSEKFKWWYRLQKRVWVSSSRRGRIPWPKGQTCCCKVCSPKFRDSSSKGCQRKSYNNIDDRTVMTNVLTHNFNLLLYLEIQ